MEGVGDNGQAGQSIGSNEQRTRPPMPTSQTRFINSFYNTYNIMTQPNREFT